MDYRIETALWKIGLRYNGAWIERAVAQKATNMTLGIMTSGCVCADNLDRTLATARYFFPMSEIWMGCPN